MQKLSLQFSGEIKSLLEAARDQNISAFGMGFGERVLVAVSLFLKTAGCCVYICADEFAAKKAFAQAAAATDNALYLPESEDLLIYRSALACENYSLRLHSLGRIAAGEKLFIVTTAAAVCGLFPPRQRFLDAVTEVKKDGEYDPLTLAGMLTDAGYRREGAAVSTGTFSLRGDILDIFPAGETAYGIRLEFFGDRLERIRRYDPYDLTPGSELEAVSVLPNTEVFYENLEKENILSRVTKELQKPESEKDAESYYRLLSHITADLESGSKDMRLWFLAPLLPHESFTEFVRPARVIFDDGREVYDAASIVYTELENRFKTAYGKGEVYKSSLLKLSPKESATRFLCPNLAFFSRDGQNRLFSTEKLFHFKSAPPAAYHRDFSVLYADTATWLSRDFTVTIFAGSDKVKENLAAFFASQKPIDSGGKGRIKIASEALPESALFFDEGQILVGTGAIVSGGGKKIVRASRRDAFLEPAVGAYVVHVYHGVGFCESVVRVAAGGAERDYCVIRYAGGDTLYVPVENMDSLSRFSEGEEAPKLSKLGGAEFARQKERVRASVKKMAFSLVELYAARSAARGHRYCENNDLYDEFCAAFPYTETEDQLTAAQECLQDLILGKVMDRLLCGDVGYGKTEVALRAAFKVIAEGKQVAFLCPTTILARQHFATAKARLEPFGISAASLTRFDSEKETAKTLDHISSGKTDIVCGTHRLLSKDVRFADLGLLILDEEQRFGVADKEKIKKLCENVNVLTLSATPIPRTLHLSLSGIRDISVLDTPPAERLPVKTYVAEYSEGLVYDAITRELGRGGQVFVVYNRVADIDRFAAGLSALLGGGIRIGVGHGQMDGERLERVIFDFSQGETQVLVASTIIENGIDMPNANTMIVVDSDRFGLSQLYQLRGRVGRSNRLAYVYFTFDGRKMLSENAQKRLDAITQFTEFGSGFKIAMRDLEIRGAGNILGREQHGHIEKVGYDTYYKILQEVVGELQGAPVQEQLPDVKVVTDFNAFLPEGYLSDKDLRVRVYARIASIRSLLDKKKLTDELTAVYGPVPGSAENLMLVSLAKNLAAKIKAETVILRKSESAVKFLKTADIPDSVSRFPSAKIKLAEAAVSFGSDRAALMKWLLGTATETG